MHAPIKSNPRLDRRVIAQVFKTQGRVHIPDVLAPASADTLFTHLSTLTPWQLSLNVGQQHLDIAHQQLMLMAPEQRETMAIRCSIRPPSTTMPPPASSVSPPVSLVSPRTGVPPRGRAGSLQHHRMAESARPPTKAGSRRNKISSARATGK